MLIIKVKAVVRCLAFTADKLCYREAYTIRGMRPETADGKA